MSGSIERAIIAGGLAMMMLFLYHHFQFVEKELHSVMHHLTMQRSPKVNPLAKMECLRIRGRI